MNVEDFEKIRKGLENVRLRASQVVTNVMHYNKFILLYC